METLASLVEMIDAIPVWVNALTGVVTAATAVTILTPTTVDDKLINGLLRVLNILAGNFGKNTNADDDMT